MCMLLTQQWFHLDQGHYRILIRNHTLRVKHVLLSETFLFLYTVSHKNDTDVAHYNFNAHQPILLIFGTDIAE